MTGHFVSPLAKDVMEWLIITSTFACAMAFHAAATRYFYAMGREGILNRWLGKTHKRWQSPYAGSFFQSGVAAVLVTLFIIMWYISKATQNFSNFQTAPYAELYGWLSILGTFWVLVMMTLSGIATIRYFGQDGHRELEHWGKWLVAPALASSGMAYALYLLWANIATLGGHINIIIALPWVASAWFLIGARHCRCDQAAEPARSTRFSAACSARACRARSLGGAGDRRAPAPTTCGSPRTVPNIRRLTLGSIGTEGPDSDPAVYSTTTQ